MSNLTIKVKAVEKNVQDGLNAFGAFKRPNLSKAPSASPGSNISRPGTPVSEKEQSNLCKSGQFISNDADPKKYGWEILEEIKKCIKKIDKEADTDIDYGRDENGLIDKYHNPLINWIVPYKDAAMKERILPNKYYELYAPTEVNEDGIGEYYGKKPNTFPNANVWRLENPPPPPYLEIKVVSEKRGNPAKDKLMFSKGMPVQKAGRKQAQTVYTFGLKTSPTPFTDHADPQDPVSNNGAARNAAAAEAKAAASKEAERVAEALAQKQRNNALHAARVTRVFTPFEPQNNGGRQTKKNRRQSRTKHRQRR